MSISVKWPGDICGCDKNKTPRYACAECWQKLQDKINKLDFDKLDSGIHCAHGVVSCDLCTDKWSLERRALVAELERHRHGVPIESDYICENELKMQAMREILVSALHIANEYLMANRTVDETNWRAFRDRVQEALK